MQTRVFAACALVALAIALVVQFVRHYRQTEYAWTQAPFYLLNLVYARIIWRTEVNGRLPDRSGQGAVIVCNHISAVDPLLIQLAARRLPHWMVATEYSRHPALAWIFRILGSIPVTRGGIDTAATKAAIRYAEQGDLVGLFPEGRVNTTNDVLLPGRPGAALIALRARVPVVPCFLRGAPYDGTSFGGFCMTAHARLTIGPPIDISSFYGRENDKEVLETLTKRFLVEMAKLAGVNDFEPRLAGRFYKPGANGQ